MTDNPSKNGTTQVPGSERKQATRKRARRAPLAVKLLMKAGVHVVGREDVQRTLVRFLDFKPKHEIVCTRV
jgi:hypothetical protein